MKLFKYMSNPDYLLNDGFIRATQLIALNDPFEANYSKEGLIELSKHLEGIDNKDKLIDYIEENMNKIGVISFSESKDNLLMWAHYANEHKGAVITMSMYSMNNIFKDLFISTCLFDKEFNLFNGKCLPVKYRKQPLYKIDKFDSDYSNIFLESEERILFDIFQQKSDEWIYEKEHRITLKLEQADKIIINNIDKYQGDFENVFEIFDIKCYIISNKQLIVNMYEIINEENRSTLGNFLSQYSIDSSNLFLFKIRPEVLSSIAYGIRVDKKTIKEYNFPNNQGYFDTFAIKKNSNYILDFEEDKL